MNPNWNESTTNLKGTSYFYYQPLSRSKEKRKWRETSLLHKWPKDKIDGVGPTKVEIDEGVVMHPNTLLDQAGQSMASILWASFKKKKKPHTIAACIIFATFKIYNKIKTFVLTFRAWNLGPPHSATLHIRICCCGFVG